MIHNFLGSVRLLSDACRSMADHAITGMSARRDRIEEHLESSLMLVTALAPRLGYEKAAAIAKKAHTEGKNLREAVLELGVLTGPEFDDLVRPEEMTRPG